MNQYINDNILEVIGNTPMVKINKLNPNPNVNIYAKLEGYNPTGSIKDRIAMQMITKAEQRGLLYPGKVILEPTSGNTGIGLAIAGIVKGYSVEIVMSSAVSVERRKIIRSFGGKVILTPADEGTDGAIRLARKMAAENPEKYFMPDQFANDNNFLTHYESTAIEIWQQTRGQIDYLVCAIGTSGTIMGVSQFLKQLKPSIKVVCAQPIKGHYIQGLKNLEEAIIPAIYDPSRIDEQIMIESEEAIEMARQLISQEGIFVGMSSGAAMLGAARLAEKIDGGNIVVVFPDRAEKYLSTKMFEQFAID
ncbi:MAG: cysteine synthase family protein [Rikenellaceae bacterium]